MITLQQLQYNNIIKTFLNKLVSEVHCTERWGRTFLFPAAQEISVA
jgi:hypothetical protein